MAAELVFVRPWPCEQTCEAPACNGKVAYVLAFTGGPVSSLYLCETHAVETEDRYAEHVRL